MVILNGILPVFIIIAIGYFLKKKKIISEPVESFINDIAYYLILPCMIFSSIYKVNIGNIKNYFKIGFGLYIAIALTFVFSLIVFHRLDEKKKRSLVTTSFRTNIAYIGFPIILNFFGTQGLAKVAIMTGFIAPFTVILSNAYLSITYKKHNINGEDWIGVIFKDPLVITSIVSIIFSYYKIWLPKFLLNTIDLLSDMGSPIMLLAVGGGLKISSIKVDRFILGLSSFIKLILMPFFSYIIFKYVLVLNDMVDFKIAVLILGFPTALASYIVVKKYEADNVLSASAITLSTMISAFTISMWIFILNY
jgi:predicted permease